MPRQAGIRYYESSEDEDYEYSRSNDRQRHGEPELEKQIVRESAAEAARSRNEEMLRDDAISSVRRPRSRIRTTASRSRELTRARESYSSDEGSGEDDEHVKQHRVEGGKVQQVGGHNRPSHSKASKLRRQGPRSLSDVCNKDTISKDNTVGNQAQMDELLASFGKKVFGMHCHELRTQPSPHTEPIYKCEYCSKTFDTRQEESQHRTYLWPSDPGRGRCKTWEEYFEEKNGNIRRRQRQVQKRLISLGF